MVYRIKIIILKLIVALIKLIYAPIKLLPIRNKVVFISRQSNKATIDIEYIDKCIKRKYPGIKSVVLTKTLTLSLIGIFSYCLEFVRQMCHMATSKVVVLDGYCIVACVLRHKKNVKIIQMWHALGAIKKFGYQTVDKPSGHKAEIAEIMSMHKNYDFVLCSSKATGAFFKEAFNIKEEQLKYIGLPRIDYIASNDERIAAEIIDWYGINANKEIILYAPTFRKGKQIELMNLLQRMDFSRFILVVKLHPLDDIDIDIDDVEPFVRENIILDKKYSAYQWMNVCDKIITDYSALGIEASLKNKPIYFYIYDYDSYEKNVGLNIDLKTEMEEYALETVEELYSKLIQEYNFLLLNKFREKYITVSTERCTERVAEFINALVEECVSE